MSLFNETEVKGENQHTQLDIKEMTKGESIGFFFSNTKDANSEEYGPFTICQGLQVDLEAKDIGTLIDTADAASFVPNTLLVNKMEEGALLEGELYRIEKAWDKGEKFSDNKKAKGWGYKLFSLSVEPTVKKQLADKYAELVNPVKAEETEAAPAGKPAV